MERLDGDIDEVVSADFARTFERENTNLHNVLDGMRDAAPSATGAKDLDEFVRVARTFSDEHYQNSLVAELRRVYRAQEETAIGNARYEYLRTLNPREFAALYDDALADERFDDLVDRYRMKREQP
jgi:hypothetical protein